MMDNRELAKYNNTTPVAYDQYLNYSDMVGTNNNSFSGFSTVSDPYIQPRGAFPIDQITSVDASPGAGFVVSGSAATVQEAYVPDAHIKYPLPTDKFF